ncbi:MAG TPA: PEP/pyruvate-binding domain-containing protein [Desulfomonilaceae bacterium]|nr:PEP/pyruvate-binding domain-containing protein [Desulfomonilaceae bacterium]
MSKITESIKRIILQALGKEQSPSSLQDLRAAFAARYHSFKLLLTANNKALEIMSDLEKALEGTRPFGMSFVKSNSTAVSVNVYRIIKHLDELAPEKYSQLYDRFKIIQDHINQSLSQRRLPKGDKLVLPFRAIDSALVDQVGSKMANVAEIGNQVHLPVPSGFVATALAYQRFVEHNDLQREIERRIQAANADRIDDLFSLSADIQQLIIRSSVPEDLELAILEAYGQIEKEAGPGVKVSVRSSALGEDAVGRSFAGQFRTQLNVGREFLVDTYKEIVASKYSLPAVTYRLNRGIPDEDVVMCVGFVAMVNAVAGGVTYSRNPLDIRDRSIFINSVWGLARAVVDGSVDPDVFVVSASDPMKIIEKKIKLKELEFVCDPDEGVCRMSLTGDRGASQSISDSQALELAAMAQKLEQYYGAPQDIEWAVTPEGSIYILQCRPLQQLSVTTIERRPAEREAAAQEFIARGGVTAAPGVASGPVFVVRNDVDKLKFPPGAILVTAQSLPRWAPLLGRASAVVTEIGGVAGHLANVAREFGVPALFGIAGATRILKDGELVTVDADGLTVYHGRVDSLLTSGETKKKLMEGSPIYDVLRRVADHIVPLNLLDPDSPEFRPAKCITFHDITRFCHEKSVHEMFSFGKEHHFSERSSKQLVCDVPMQWWIINLDDGFKEDVEGKFVQLGNIVSIPMLALWEGVTAVPWGGPPPVDSKGLMSILVQATSNPALDPATASPYAARNYFMLSKNFCSLTSRFGFHFSTVEALVGERPPENYISFSFKGGAADYRRRRNRAALVANILDKFGFRVETKEDSAFARVEGLDEESMKARLKILGYLIIHTRQLDMVMSNDNSTYEYKKKLLDDIESIVQDKSLIKAEGRFGPSIHETSRLPEESSDKSAY